MKLAVLSMDSASDVARVS